LEDEEEAFPLILVDQPARRLDGDSQQSPMVGEHWFRSDITNVLDQACGGLNVSEE
jgi:hypothetical protein